MQFSVPAAPYAYESSSPLCKGDFNQLAGVVHIRSKQFGTDYEVALAQRIAVELNQRVALHEDSQRTRLNNVSGVRGRCADLPGGLRAAAFHQE